MGTSAKAVSPNADSFRLVPKLPAASIILMREEMREV